MQWESAETISLAVKKRRRNCSCTYLESSDTDVDEPTSPLNNLNNKGTECIQEIILGTGKIVLVVAHRASESDLALIDRAIMLDQINR